MTESIDVAAMALAQRCPPFKLGDFVFLLVNIYPYSHDVSASRGADHALGVIFCLLQIFPKKIAGMKKVARAHSLEYAQLPPTYLFMTSGFDFFFIITLKRKPFYTFSSQPAELAPLNF